MKKILYILCFSPCLFYGQEQLSLDDILTIDSKNNFLKVVIESGYSEGNTTSEKTYYGKGFKEEKSQATDWAEYTSEKEEFYFEQSDLSFVRKHGKDGVCYYDAIIADIKKQCEFLKIMNHDSKKNGDINFATYSCPGAKFKGPIGYAQVEGNGVIQEFSK